MNSVVSVELNSREKKIIAALKNKMSESEICEQMKITKRTLAFYLNTLLLKSGAKTIDEVIEKQ